MKKKLMKQIRSILCAALLIIVMGRLVHALENAPVEPSSPIMQGNSTLTVIFANQENLFLQQTITPASQTPAPRDATAPPEPSDSDEAHKAPAPVPEPSTLVLLGLGLLGVLGLARRTNQAGRDHSDVYTT